MLRSSGQRRRRQGNRRGFAVAQRNRSSQGRQPESRGTAGVSLFTFSRKTRAPFAQNRSRSSRGAAACCGFFLPVLCVSPAFKTDVQKGPFANVSLELRGGGVGKKCFAQRLPPQHERPNFKAAALQIVFGGKQPCTANAYMQQTARHKPRPEGTEKSPSVDGESTECLYIHPSPHLRLLQSARECWPWV